jgi:hypothetical protein
MANGHEFQIEDGIPMPTPKGGGGMRAALRKLKAGQSILFPEDSSENSVSASAHQILGQGNYACRKVEGGIRVWRTK